jgi:hypothetical protein
VAPIVGELAVALAELQQTIGVVVMKLEGAVLEEGKGEERRRVV